MARAPHTGYDAHVPFAVPVEVRMGLVFGCGGGLFGLFVVLLIGRALVCMAVALANRVVGPAPPPDTFGQWDDWDSDDEPAYVKSRRRGTTDGAIPEPGLASGMLITFVAGLINAGGCVACVVFAQAVFDDLDRSDEWILVALALLGLPVTFVVHSFLLVLLLPTTFWRAALVALFHYLILVVIAIVTVGAIYLVLGA